MIAACKPWRSGRPFPSCHGAREGYALLVVLLVVAVVSLVAYQFTDAMTSEYVAAVRTTDVVQARLNALSGIYYAAAMMADPNAAIEDPFDNPNLANVAIRPTENLRQDPRFTLLSVVSDGNGGYTTRYGISDEGGKLNLNALIQLDTTGQLLHDALLTLPNMTEEIADAIVDWLDPDDNERTAGAESGYYLSLEQPYRAKNGPLNTLDELLLVRGVTVQLLYGNDRNRNGIADDTPQASSGVDRGWADYLTVYGRELNADRDGAARIYLGESDDLRTFHQTLTNAVGSDLADYILAYKLFDVSQVSSSAGATTAGNNSSSTVVGTPEQLSQAVQAALRGQPTNRRRLRSVLSLVGTQVTLPATASGSPSTVAGGGRNPPGSGNANNTPPKIVVPCPLNDPAVLAERLPELLDRTTGREDFEMIPRLNILTAPREALLALTAMSVSQAAGRRRRMSPSSPPLTEANVDAIISARASLSPTDPDAQTAAWLVTTVGIAPSTFARLERFITGRSMIYRVQSLGYFSQGGPLARIEAVIDTNQGTPRIVHIRDLTELDIPRGFQPPR
jgi:hypothetical protein